MDDFINKPPHYTKGAIETIEAIESALGKGFEFYLQGNIMKYIWRYTHKNQIEDLKKAQWYLSN